MRVELGSHAGLFHRLFPTHHTGDWSSSSIPREGFGRKASPCCAGRAGALVTGRHEREDGEDGIRLASPDALHPCCTRGFLFTLPAVPHGGCMQPGSPRGRLLRPPQGRRSVAIQRPLLHPHSWNPGNAGLGVWTLEAESRGALVFTAWTATQETDATELFFFLNGSRYPCVCQSTNRMHTHFRPCIYTETGSFTFFFFKST